MQFVYELDNQYHSENLDQDLSGYVTIQLLDHYYQILHLDERYFSSDINIYREGYFLGLKSTTTSNVLTADPTDLTH